MCIFALFQEVVDLQVAQWRQKFGKIQGGKNIVALTGETSADLRLLESGDVIFAITNYSPDRPAIVFVSSRRQCRLTAVDLLTFCAADGITDRFLHAHASDIENHLKHVNDKAFAETLQPGVGFYHEALRSKINES